MPKKTKKEKILAMYHRKLRLLEDRQAVTPSVTPSVQVKTPVNTTKIIENKTSPEITEPVNQYFFSDLKKSLLLIVLILGIEVSLYAAKLVK